MRFALTLSLLLASPAWAEEPDMAATIGVAVEGAVLGRLKTTTDFSQTTVGIANTLGISGRFHRPIDEYFTLGAAVGLSRWHLEDTEGGSTLFEISFRPGARYTIQEGLEAYGVVPIGLTVSYLPEATWGDSDATLGWHAGLLAGLRGAITEDLRLFAEAGYLRRAARHDPFGITFRARLHEPVLRVGASFVLP